MGKWTTIAEAAIELLSKKSGGALPADEAASVVPKLLRDNPGAKDPEFYGPGGWLGSKIREAAENRASSAPDTTKATLGGMEGVTGFFRENLRIRPDALRGIKGAMGEERFAGGAKLKNLEDSIAKEGYRDDSPVLIAVREDGTPFIVEGNNRVEEAIKTGRPHIKVQLQYLRGAEDVAGPLSPDNLPSVMALPTDEASRRLSLAPSTSEAEGLGKRQRKGRHVYSINDGAENIGFLDVENIEDGVARISDIVISDPVKRPGPAGMRRLLEQLRQAHPEIKSIAGERVSGARRGGGHGFEGSGQEVSVPLPLPTDASRAGFDPAKSESGDILASVPAIATGLAGYGALSNVVEENNGQSSN